jgi:hypothetical protein
MCTYNLFKFKYSCMVFSVPWNEMKMWHSLESYPHHGPNESFCIASSRRLLARSHGTEQRTTAHHSHTRSRRPLRESIHKDLLDTEIAGDVRCDALAWWWAAECRQSDPLSFNLSTFGYIWIGVRAQNLLWASFLRFGSPEGVKRFLIPNLLTDDGRTLGREACWDIIVSMILTSECLVVPCVPAKHAERSQ